MRLRYMTHWKLKGINGKSPSTVFAGVWVQGPDLRGDLDYRYLPGFPEEEERANETINAIVERGGTVPEDFFENLSNSGYLDAWGPVVETDEYDSIRGIEDAIMAKHGPKHP